MAGREPFWTPRVLNEMLRAADVHGPNNHQFRMCPSDYREVMRTGRDYLDPLTNAPAVGIGHVGTIFGILVMVSRAWPEDVVYLYKFGTVELAHMVRGGEPHVGKCADPECLVREVMLS